MQKEVSVFFLFVDYSLGVMMAPGVTTGSDLTCSSARLLNCGSQRALSVPTGDVQQESSLKLPDGTKRSLDHFAQNLGGIFFFLALHFCLASFSCLI
jgi:hypothetical protein